MNSVTASPASRRPRWPVLALATAGVLLVLAGALLATVPVHGETIPRWNGLCASGAGQIGQFFDSSVHEDCSTASLADHLIGWLLGCGFAAVAAAGLVWLARRPRSG